MTLTQRLFLVARGTLITPFFSWIAVLLGVLVIYVLSASAPTLGETTWQEAAGFASQLWLTSFGAQIPLGEGVLSLMPLTLTLLYMLASYRILRRRGIATWLEVLIATVLPVAFVAVVGLVAGEGGAWWYAIVGIGVISAGIAIFAGREFLFYGQQWFERASRAWPRTRILLVSLAVIALVFTVIAVISGFSRVLEIHGYYLTGPSGSVGLVLLQLLYLPNFIIWGLAWLLGPGFSVGTDTSFSVLGSEAGPLPAIPMLGAIPKVNLEMPWILAVIAVIFLVLGVVHATRNFGDRTHAEVAIGDLIAGGIVALTLAVLALASSGGIGPGRMSSLGVEPSHMLLATLALVVVPFMLGHLVGHPRTRSKLKAVTTKE